MNNDSSKRNSLPSILAEIVQEKKKEISELRKKAKTGIHSRKLPPVRDFKGAISSKEIISIIAEIKFASPSAGTIRNKIDPLKIGRTYEKAGASAISLITDKKYFKGDPNHLPRLKANVSLPILRKDFIIDESQVIESSLLGADAVLLIARILSNRKLKELLSISADLGMDSLTETHNEEDIQKAIECGAEIIGINNRDLDTFEVKTRTTLRLASHLPADVIVVSESGIETTSDIEILKRHSVHAALVGTSLMKSDNMEKKLKDLVFAGKNKSYIQGEITTNK